ncbi:hypothetical protein FEE59_24480 [Herbaspirillum sp. RU 5E]|nr:hypothetical protein [Herbaspirillum sp. RU 5E]
MSTKAGKQPRGAGGGAAAASGMNFQCRVAALAMAHALIEYEDYSALSLDAGYRIKSIHLETCDEIDDVVLEGTHRVLIQAKRNLPLSDSPNSQLSKVIQQFVFHHLHHERKTDDRYILATSSESSSRITIDLRKITASLRLNADALKSNPLTLAEKDVIKKIKSLIERHWKQLKRSTPSEEEVLDFIKAIWVLPLDIEANGSDERLVVALLRSRSKIEAPLLWSATLEVAFDLMKNRQSIDINGLLNILGIYIKPEGEKKSALEDFKLDVAHGTVSTGKEVVIFDGYLGTDALCFGEFNRFRDDGTRTFQFSENSCILPNGTTRPIYYRGAAVTGLERFLSSHQELLRNKKSVFLHPACAEKPDEGVYAVAHRKLLSKMLFEKSNLFNCLICDSPISEDRALSVEIDEVGKSLDVGFIHKRCHRPSLRVLGEIQSELFSVYSYLTDFDYEGWILANRFGPSSLAQFPHDGVVATAAWQFASSSSSRGLWCIRVNLDDGSAGYVTQRGKVERFGKQEAYEKAAEFSDSYIKQLQQNDPWVYTSDHSVSGTLRDVRRRFGARHKLLKCKNAEAIPFDAAIDATYSSRNHHYAPLVVLLSKDTGKPLLIDGAIHFLADPFQLSQFLENWAEAGKNMDEYVVHVVSDDIAFDSLVVTANYNNYHIYINPIFGSDGVLMSGIEVVPLDEIIEAFSNAKQ